MKLSNETLTVLKNFSSINESLLFREGNKLTTVSSSKTVLAEATLKDSFPQDFCVYDLNQFLSVYSLYKDKTELEFDESNIIFRSGRSKIKYRMAAKEMIVTPPDKTITLPSEDCVFEMDAEVYEEILKTSSVLSSPHIAIQSDGSTITLGTFDAANDSAHTNSITIAEVNDGKVYKIVFKTENLKMIPGSYKVTISFKGIGHFKNVKDDIQYWIAFEAKDSKIG
jgi:hypothetical protein